MTNHPRPVEWRQLCVIARDLLQAAPTIDDGEWKARIKDRVIALGLTYPAARDGIDRAMRAVEVALTKRGLARPVPIRQTPARPTPPRQDDPPWRWGTVRVITGPMSLREIAASLLNSDSCARPSPSPVEARGDNRAGGARTGAAQSLLASE